MIDECSPAQKTAPRLPEWLGPSLSTPLDASDHNRADKRSDLPATSWDCRFWVLSPEQIYGPFSLGAKMVKSEQGQGGPTELNLEQFRQPFLPHLSVGSRNPAPKLSMNALFCYILKLLYTGCQCKQLPIEKDQ
jgi:hypothetical protein